MNPQIQPITNFRRRRPVPWQAATCGRSAFTLVELLLTAALLLALTMVAVPTLSELWKRHRLDRAATNVRLALARARIAAIELNTPMRFQCDIGANTFAIAPAKPSPVVAPTSRQARMLVSEFRPRSDRRAPTANRPRDLPTGTPYTFPGQRGPRDIGIDHEFQLPGFTSRGPRRTSFTIWIYPDGTLRGEELWITNRDGEIRKLQFDEVTGEIRVRS